MNHPMQPIVLEDGVPRFKSNSIIRWLFETGRLDLNEVSRMMRDGAFPVEDYVQITQLLGYSISGWGDLSTSPPELVEEADRQAAELIRANAELKVEQEKGKK